MLIDKVRKEIRADLESPAHRRRVGTGWLSGVIAFLCAIAGLLFVLCLRYPALLTVPQTHALYALLPYRIIVQGILIAGFAMAIVSLILRSNRVLGFTSITIILFATILGGAGAKPQGPTTGGIFLGLDWFVLNIVFTGLLFIPIERLFARYPDQHLFREEWREDLFYYFVSSLFVQVLTFLSMTPAMELASHTSWTSFRHAVGSQPVILQLLELMFFTDLVQYWVHRLFHRVPFLWGFHAVHHSAKSMDWMAAARMHFIEILVLRGTTVIPMMILGFAQLPIHLYILIVYVHSALLHANVRWEFNRVGKFLAMPRFHHWHHGVEKEAIDVNFSIHFPLFDRLFGTYHLPPGQWPTGYGIEGHPVPRSYFRQFLYPFVRRKG